MSRPNINVSSKMTASHPSRCTFTFSDGRQCRTPRLSDDPFFCIYHARKEAQARAAEQVGREVSGFLSRDFLSACDLSLALARLFAAAVEGQIKPRTAATLAYLGQTLVQTIQLAQHEYINAFSTDGWRHAVRSSFRDRSAQVEVPDQVLDPRERRVSERVEALKSADDRTALRALESTLEMKWPAR